MKFCLDPGHGGIDSGAMFRSGVREADINLSVALKTADRLKTLAQQVILTRSHDTKISLLDRVRIANLNNVDVFCSIHCNFASNPQARGIEIFHYPGSEKGNLLATTLLGSVLSQISLPVRGIKTQNFYVLRYTKMPAALIELEFLSNPEASCLLTKEWVQNRFADGIAFGLVRFAQKYAQKT
ncbi:MAG: N-acetylmuramoyl-L-alanine amidase [candidate division WOR-3 bacterium]|nr:N-acetylmuramoyl-L-alanine amidase [candidate division WOR-3 bacterium]